MKTVEIPKTSLGAMSLEDAFAMVFGNATLKQVHGPSLRVTDWNQNKRKIQFSIAVSNIPREIRRFFCGESLRITTRQERKVTPAVIEVQNKMRMHFLGAELFRVKPFFYLEHDGKAAYIRGKVEHAALLPPPINVVAELFMAAHSKKEMESFANVLLVEASKVGKKE